MFRFLPLLQFVSDGGLLGSELIAGNECVCDERCRVVPPVGQVYKAAALPPRQGLVTPVC